MAEKKLFDNLACAVVSLPKNRSIYSSNKWNRAYFQTKLSSNKVFYFVRSFVPFSSVWSMLIARNQIPVQMTWKHADFQLSIYIYHIHINIQHIFNNKTTQWLHIRDNFSCTLYFLFIIFLFVYHIALLI